MKIVSISAQKPALPKTIDTAVKNSTPKLRVAYAQPGRYVLKSARGVFSIVRLSKEAKYTPSMKQKIFALRSMEAIASDYSAEELALHSAFEEAIGNGEYQEPIDTLMAEAISYEEEFLNAKGAVTAKSPVMYGFFKFKDGSSVDLTGDKGDLAKAKALFKNGRNPVVSLTDLGLDEDEAQTVVEQKARKNILIDTPSKANKFLSTSSSQAGIDSESAAPRGRGGSAAGAKMGRKKRAPNMLAPGWHMFSLPKGATRMTKAYIGPRISARRILTLVENGGTEPSEPKVADKPTSGKSVDKSKALDKAKQPVKTARGAFKPMAAKAKELLPEGYDVTATNEGSISITHPSKKSVKMTIQVYKGKVIAGVGKTQKRGNTSKRVDSPYDGNLSFDLPNPIVPEQIIKKILNSKKFAAFTGKGRNTLTRSTKTKSSPSKRSAKPKTVDTLKLELKRLQDELTDLRRTSNRNWDFSEKDKVLKLKNKIKAKREEIKNSDKPGADLTADARARNFLKEYGIKGTSLKRLDYKDNKGFSTEVTKAALSKLLSKVGDSLKAKPMSLVGGTVYEGTLPNAGRIHINSFDKRGTKAIIFFHD
ncbi:hypothetical protein BN7874_223 [Phage NCTB]|nr:hypothetical protein BN7874_223 [Phage NCTB]